MLCGLAFLTREPQPESHQPPLPGRDIPCDGPAAGFGAVGQYFQGTGIQLALVANFGGDHRHQRTGFRGCGMLGVLGLALAFAFGFASDFGGFGLQIGQLAVESRATRQINAAQAEPCSGLPWPPTVRQSSNPART